jgi:hypothetical protein
MTTPLRWALSLVVVLAATALGFSARAQTVEECMSGCGDAARACEAVGDGREASCADTRSSCLSDCQYWSGGASTRPSQFGAIAYSPSARATGVAYDWGDRASAEDAALNACLQLVGTTAGCEVVLWFYNNCGAIATTPDGTYGTGYGARKYLAEGYALQVCRQQGGGDSCAVQRTICTGM